MQIIRGILHVCIPYIYVHMYPIHLVDYHNRKMDNQKLNNVYQRISYAY